MSIPVSNCPEDRVSAQTSFAPLCFRILLMSALAPVFCPGCSDPSPAFAEDGLRTRTAIQFSVSAHGAEPSGIRSLDIFFFNDDPLQRLDAYQRLEGGVLPAAVGASRSGRKILAVLANHSPEGFHWAEAASLEVLRARMFRLQDEDPAHPQMSALQPVMAGSAVPVTLSSPLSCIEVGSLKCDFSERNYRDASLEDVRIYLTNVNAAVPVFCDTLPSPVEILHAGRFRPADQQGFRHPEILIDSLPQPVGKQICHPETRLYCYPNATTQSSPGSPPTRLVIEGKMQGKTCFYPLEIGRGTWGVTPPGILPGRTYRFDVTLTRRGADTPDMSLEPGTVQCSLSVMPWNERNDTVIDF